MYIKWRVSKAGVSSYFLVCTCIHTVTLTYFNTLYDNAAMVNIAKPSDTKHLQTVNMPVDKKILTHRSKKLKLKQIRMTK